MIKPITNAAIEAPRVSPDTRPLARYSRTTSKEEPKRIAINGRENLPRVTSFGFGRFGSGDSFIGYTMGESGIRAGSSDSRP
jgi:hypothetical protein